MTRVARTAATRPGPKPPIQAVTMMARKKTGATSPSGRTKSVTISAAATLERAKPYLQAADALCAELSDSNISCLMRKLGKGRTADTEQRSVTCGDGTEASRK